MFAYQYHGSSTIMEHLCNFHTYCKKQRSSRRGKNPVQIETPIQLEFSDQSRPYKKWSEDEKLAMMEFVKKHGIPSVNVNKYWEECGRYIFQTLGLVKTGASCRSQYARMKCFFPSKCLTNDQCAEVSNMSSNSTKKEVSTQYDCIYTCTVSTQTDPPLPVTDISR
ncbi:hypothetical protein ACJMK2_041710 [Sinanodonta woodiana]|uniref:Myb-like domain-containing protein n=1 Tax=Sinanodonta woodiana TaxID=1069815 RepID=A0ABD3W605_SINWO